LRLPERRAHNFASRISNREISSVQAALTLVQAAHVDSKDPKKLHDVKGGNMSSILSRALGAAITGALASLLLAAPAQARITKITITSIESPTFGGTSFGAVGQYEKLIGTVTGEVDPNDRRNDVIVDVKLAPKNGRGRVEYSTDILILRPIDAARGNHRLLYDVTNRGNTNVLGIFNDSNAGNNPSSAADAGSGYLMRNGWTVLLSGWDFSAPCNRATQTCGPDQQSSNFTATVPVATNPDGSPIFGLNSEELVVDTGQNPSTLPLTYPASTLDQSKASLTVRVRYADTPVVIPASGWAYVNPTAVKLTTGNFTPTHLYEFTYPAMNPVVAGLGFAAIRDLATFLRDGNADDSGTPNPLKGRLELLYSTCSSQPCRTMRDFVALGFNESDGFHHRGRLDRDDDGDHGRGHDGDRGVQVFDGVLNWKGGGSGIFLNYRFSQPVRTHRQHIARWTPEIQFPFANERIHDRVTGKTAGRLDRCKDTHTCPKIVEANSANEFWAKAGSNLLTDSRGRDIDDLDSGVRYYLESSAPHGAASGKGICAMERNPLGPNQLLRALLADLDAWAAFGRRPPENRVPRARDGTLVPPLPQAGEGFPDIEIPGVTVPYNGVLHTGDLLDFGPRFDSEGIMDILPPVVTTPYPSLVPKTDADGNDIAGVRMPEIAVPLATYTGWNLRANGNGDGCDASGTKIAFATTPSTRAPGDPRKSILERYPTHQVYVDMVTRAVQKLQKDGFLVDEDAQKYISDAQASAVPN
jgi:hypothetical protein